MSAPDDAPGWHLVPRLLLRRAGFGFDVLESLADPVVNRSAVAFREASVELDGVRGLLLGEVLPAAVRRARDDDDRAGLRRLSAVRSAVGRGRNLPATVPAPATAGTGSATAGTGSATAGTGSTTAGIGSATAGTGSTELVDALSAYRQAWERARAAEEALVAAVADDRADWGRRVRKELTPEVLDALLQLAPSAYDGVIRWLAASGAGDTSRDRAVLRRLYRYLQRLAAKNETTSAFGPLVHGIVDPAGPITAPGIGRLLLDDVRLGEQTPSGVRATEPFVAFWAVAALARRMAQDPQVRPRVPVTWVPVNRLDGDRLILATGQGVRLSPVQAALAAAVDGRRNLGELAAAAGSAPAEADRELDRLERLGVVRTWPEPASVVTHPFADLLADAHRLAVGTAWPQRLSLLQERVHRYAAAPDHEARRVALEELERDFEDLTGVPARRAGGRMYADRSVAHLDCAGDLGPVRIGPRLAGRIEWELSAVLDLGAAYGELRRAAHQERVRQVLRAAGVRRLPYDELIRRMQADTVTEGTTDRGSEGGGDRGSAEATDRGSAEATGAGTVGPVEPAAVADLTARLTALVAGRTRSGRDGREGHPGVCVLSAQDLRGLSPAPSGPVFASPDLLLRLPAPTDTGVGGAALDAASGAGHNLPTPFVLGEVHPYVFAWGSQRLFCPDPDGLDDDVANELACWGGAGSMAVLVPRRRHKGLIADAFPGRFVELAAVATRDRSRTLALTDLVVEDLGDRVVLRDGQGDVVLYAGQDDHPHLLAFAPPAVEPFPLVRIGDGAPRIVVGELVAQRAGWWVPAAELLAGRTDGSHGFAGVQRLRARRGVPRWVYAHVPGEPKPVCFDLNAPLAVDTLLAMVASAPHDTVLLREMLPEPGALWLHRRGRPHTSELRLALTRRPR